MLTGCGGTDSSAQTTTVSGPSQSVTPTVHWSNPTPITYGTALSAAQLNATASMAGAFTYVPTLGAMLPAGMQTLTVTFTPTSASATSLSQSVTLIVNKATPVLSWTTPAAVSAGSALSATQLDASASVPGSFVYTPSLGTVLTTGTETLQVAFTPTDDTDFAATTASVPIVANQPPVLGFSASSYTANENSGWLVIPLVRTGSANGAVSVSYSTKDGSASAGGAYGASNGSVSWADGDTASKLITVPILDQGNTSGSQSFSISLSSPQSGAVVAAQASATVTINDNDSTLIDSCQPNAAGGDATASYCTTPNFPTYGTPALALPANPNAAAGDGLSLTSSATNAFSLVMGTATPLANMVTDQSVRNAFYMNYLVGNLASTLGSPADTGQANNSVFAAVARHYAVNDPNDVHLMSTDGLHLRAICSKDHTDCSPGNVYAGMIRVPAEIRPGMTIKVRYRSPAGQHSWAPIWLYSGSEYSPGPGGNPYQGFGTASSLVRLGSGGDSFEIDLNDNYPRWDNNPSVPTGEQLDYGTPNIYGVAWNTPPHSIYWASGSGYTYQTGSAPAFEQVAVNMSTGFHDLVLSWQTDNLLYEFVDGKLVVESYMEYPASTYVDALANGVTQSLAMSLIIGNQAIASFTPGGASATENDGMADGWTIVVQEISVWNGNVANPQSFQAAPNGCDAACQQP